MRSSGSTGPAVAALLLLAAALLAASAAFVLADRGRVVVLRAEVPVYVPVECPEPEPRSECPACPECPPTTTECRCGEEYRPPEPREAGVVVVGGTRDDVDR